MKLAQAVILYLLLLISGIVINPAFGAVFTDVSTGTPLSDSAISCSAAWGDYDNDGDLDIYVTNREEIPNRLFRNDEGTFVDIAPGTPLAGASDSNFAIWADYDNDGDLDLYLVNYKSPSRLLRNNGDSFADVAPDTPLVGNGVGSCAAWGDYDSDGDLDLYVARVSDRLKKACQLFRNDNEVFIDIAPGTPLVLMGSSVQSPIWGDYDNDGDLDLYLAGEGITGHNHLFRNDDSEFVDVTGAIIDRGSKYANGAVWVDYDNDGDLDLHVVRVGVNSLYRNDGGKRFIDVARDVGLAPGPEDECVSWADYDNDGDLDAYITSHGDRNRLFRNEGGVFRDITSVTPFGIRGWNQGAVWGDYDNDGDLDLYAVGVWMNHLFRNETNNGNYLFVRPLNADGNMTCFGALVRVYHAGTAGLLGMRSIDGGSGHSGQNAYDAHFGLDPDRAYDVEVTFVGGRKIRHNNVIPNALPNHLLIVLNRPEQPDNHHPIAGAESDTMYESGSNGNNDDSELSSKEQSQSKAKVEAAYTNKNEMITFIEDQPPAAKITFPEDGDYIRGTIPIKGTAVDAYFYEYVLLFRGANSRGGEWKNPVIDGDLISGWPTENLKGDYEIRLEVRDFSGNQSTDSVLVHIDDTPPEIFDVFPADRMVISNNSPTIRAVLKDGESGIDENSIVLEVDGQELAHSFDAVDGLLQCKISRENPLQEGIHSLSIECKDRTKRDGNLSSVTAVFAVYSKKFEVLYVYSPPEHGYSELKRAESEIWETLKPGMALKNEDWVRVPPLSILKLKQIDGDKPCIVVGCKQQLVARLLLEANAPATSFPETKDNLNPEFPNMVKPVPPFEDVPNIGKALWIFNRMCSMKCMEIQELSSEIEKVSLPVRCEMKDEGIYLLFDSGISQAEVGKITVNPMLYPTENSSKTLGLSAKRIETVWIPLYISSETSDFVSAWYEGARIARELTGR